MSDEQSTKRSGEVWRQFQTISIQVWKTTIIGDSDPILSTTQIGRIAESLVASTLMLASGGRLSPFTALSDDCGVDLVVLDKLTSRTLCIQMKCRSENDRRRAAQFGVRKASFRGDAQPYLLAFPFNPEKPALTRSWFIPMARVPYVAVKKKDRYAISPSTATGSKDRCSKYRQDQVSDLVSAIFEALEGRTQVVDSGMP
ncbi:hypothetical protein [Hyphomicrobium sp.]|uniref:hypothetical protein n=1 Tax=Hyphomicrobium sp. TaxID=82 RepID=UPI001E07D4FB|nr:hypothetical protein [Hyphomicrobium sp.]MBY0558500.1 hypothetical protein [Hyphomicrobium sp.]